MVIDPRRTDTCELADLHLALLPGTDVALFHGILHILLWEDWIDRSFIAEHTEGFADLKELVRDYTPAAVADICGIDRADLQRCAEWIGRSPRFLSLWCMGLNQSSAGSAKNSALINLHLATGKIGRAGCGPFSSPASRTPWAVARPAAWPICCPATAKPPIPAIAPKWRTTGVWNSCPRPRSQRHRAVRCGPRRPDQGALDRLYQPRAIAAGPAQDPRGPCPLSLRGGPGSLRRHGNLPIRRPFASSRILGRKGRLRDHPERRISHVRRAVPPPVKRARTGTSSATSRAAWKGTCVPLNPACSPLPTAAACSTNTSCLPPAATLIFPASATHCSTAWGRSNGHFPLARSKVPHGSMQTAASLPPRDARNWSPNPTAPPRKT